jgi:hypothetical protein
LADAEKTFAIRAKQKKNTKKVCEPKGLHLFIVDSDERSYHLSQEEKL